MKPLTFKTGERVTVHIPGYRIWEGSILTGRPCGEYKQSYRVKSDTSKYPATIHHSFLRPASEAFA